METKIQSIHLDVTKQLQTFTQKKMSKLEKYYEDIKKVEALLRVVKPETAENKGAGITVLIPDNDLHVDRICNTFEEMADLYVEALGKQLVKYKGK